ncbi:MAG: SpoIID/LytB domain-containing protein [bacterium]|nr:SpoIID/LytB domain-containing protein [bacterium]
MTAPGGLKGKPKSADLALVRQLRRLLFVFVVAFSMIVSTVISASADDAEVVVEGGGWGHGIGMSQYGAFGQALEGHTGEEIVGYYYPGSGTAPLANQVDATHFLTADNTPLWVNLLANRTSLRFEAIDGPLRVCQSGTVGCDFNVSPGEVWRLTTLGDGTCQFEVDGVPAADPAGCDATVKGMSPNGARIEVGGLDASRDEFARGRIRVRTPNAGSTFHVSLEINLEEYLYGLAEMPFSWHSEALRAQALAGRSYATWKALSNGPEDAFSATRKANCWCHVYATTADQSYSGWANEAAIGADRWQDAVDSTAGTVITHRDASEAGVVAAFYSSSTGGATENKEDMWGGSPVSYLQSRPDPWSQAPTVNNPFGEWQFSFNEDDLAARFGVDKVDGLEITSRYASGTPSMVDIFTRKDGAKTTIHSSGPDLFTTLDLRGRNIDSFNYGTIPTVGGDFNGDGRDDVAMVTGFNDAWWIGQSSPGEFAMDTWLNHAPSGNFGSPLSGDFNGDGMTDVAILHEDTGRLFVGMSTGSRFRAEVWANHGDPDRWGSLLVGDFDGDGAHDIAEYDNFKERWRIYRLDDGDLVREFWYDFAVTNPNWASHTVGDYNGDGKDDILSRDAATGDLIVLFSEGTSLTPHAWQSLPHAGPWQYTLSADFTGDGTQDLATFDAVAGSWWVVAGTNTTAAMSPASWFTFGIIGQTFARPVAADFSGDDRAEIVMYNRSNGKLKVLTSDGSSFTKSLWGSIPAKSRVTTIMALNANGNGRTDIAAWDNTRRRWWVGRNQANTNFAVSRWGTLLR